MRLQQAIPDVLGNVQPQRIRSEVEALERISRSARREQSRESALYVQRRLEEAGLEVRIEEVRLFVPEPREAVVEMIRPVAYVASFQEAPEGGSEFSTDDPPPPPIVAYTPDGDVRGNLVYLHKAAPEDFDELRAAQVTLKRAIGIARVDGPSVAMKLRLAEEHGLSGLILYADPSTQAPSSGGQDEDRQARQFTIPRCVGIDPKSLAGDFDALMEASATGSPPSSRSGLPRIPAVSLSAHDTRAFLQSLRGPLAKVSWQGGFEFRYHLGGTPSVTAHLRTRSEFRVQSLWNVIAVLRGSIESGTHVHLTAPRTPLSKGGTAALIEIARALSEAARRGARPARSLVFSSFDPGSTGSLGSLAFERTERTRLQESLVAALDCGFEADGSKFVCRASEDVAPVLRAAILAAGPGADESSLEVAPEDGSVPGDASILAASGGRPVASIRGAPTSKSNDTAEDPGKKADGPIDPAIEHHAHAARALALSALLLTSSTAHPTDVEDLAASIDAAIATLPPSTPESEAALNAAATAFREAAREFSLARETLLSSDPDPLALIPLNHSIHSLLAPSLRVFLAASRRALPNSARPNEPSSTLEVLGPGLLPMLRSATTRLSACTVMARDLAEGMRAGRPRL